MPFTKGHKLSKGRPKGSKNILPLIKDKVLAKLYSRIKELDTVDIEELLSFARNIMPKDVSIKVAPDIQYITNTPSHMLDGEVPKIIDVTQEETKKITQEEISQSNLNKSLSMTIDNNNSNYSSNDNDNSNSSNDISMTTSNSNNISETNNDKQD